MLISKLPTGIVEFGQLGNGSAGSGSASDIILATVQRVSDREYGGNITADLVQVGPTRIRLKINIHSTFRRIPGGPKVLAPGARRSPSGRAIKAASWEVFRDVLTQIFEWLPDCQIETALITYRGKRDFHLKYPATAAKNVGSLAAPQSYAPGAIIPENA